jgi:hypothetical protein
MRDDNTTGIRNLCAVAAHLRATMPTNAATKFAIRTVLREAINKSCPEYKGNINRKNVRHISVLAKAALEMGDSKVIADHAIPVSISLLEVRSHEQGHSVDELVTLVAKYSTMVLITEEEDQKLRRAGLVKSMPENWDGIDLFARYRHVGIQLVPPTAEA